jgi:hypothetical protein|tara:strand:+ start:57 stop:362 length:306 start_codon:yes stop_codon:yes gene_type:complete
MLVPTATQYAGRVADRFRLAQLGAGILSQFHGWGENLHLCAKMEKTVREAGFGNADLTRVTESVLQMRSDLVTVGGAGIAGTIGSPGVQYNWWTVVVYSAL